MRHEPMEVAAAWAEEARYHRLCQYIGGLKYAGRDSGGMDRAAKIAVSEWEFPHSIPNALRVILKRERLITRWEEIDRASWPESDEYEY